MITLAPARALRILMACGLVTLGALSHAQQVLRVTAIPDESPTELARKAAPLMKYAERLFARPAFSEALTSAERGMRK